MSDDFVESKGPRAANSRVVGSAPIEESFGENTGGWRGGGQADAVIDRVPDRAMPESLNAILARVDGKAKEAAVVEKPAEAVVEAVEKPVESAIAEVAAAKPDAVIVQPDAVTAERDRYAEANRRLVIELEEARKSPTPHSMLVEAGNAYIDNPTKVVKQLIASSLGIDNLDDPRVADEFKDLYTQLTADSLGVTPDEAHQAKREAVRTRHLLEREKRERKAEKPATDDAAAFIGNRLQAKRSDGRSLADDHPLLVQFAEKLEGKKPEKLIRERLEREIRTGRIAVSGDDDAMIAQAAKLIETDYQALADSLGKARTPSTAPPKKEAPPSASNETRQQPAARTLTSADASVAPATPPAPKSTPTEKPKFKSDKERREWALRHLDKATLRP